MCSSIPFGCASVLLIGDPVQLSPIQGQSLWNQNSSNANDSRGFDVYRLFTSVVELVENYRLERSGPDIVYFMASFRDSGMGKTQRGIGRS
eukprot:2630172-Ditylum_brightwellii.AAC.1